MREYVNVLFRELYNNHKQQYKDVVSFECYVDNMSDYCTVEEFDAQMLNHDLLEDVYDYFTDNIVSTTPHGFISRMFFFTTEYYIINDEIRRYFYTLLRKKKLDAITNNIRSGQ